MDDDDDGITAAATTTALLRRHAVPLSWLAAAVASVCFLVGYTLAPAPQHHQRHDQRLDQPRRNLVAEREVSLTDPLVYFYNEYTYIKPLQQSNYPWENIVEPYRKTTFLVANPSPSHTYTWYVGGWHVKEDSPTADINFGAPTGTPETVTVQARDRVTGAVVATRDVPVMVKYVRRELRQLVDQDRDAFFQAVAVLQRVPTQTGKRLYGPR